MKKVHDLQRHDWKELAEEVGFEWYDADGVYWDENSAYEFTLNEIDNDLAAPAEELHQMCLEVVADAVERPDVLTQLGIPEDMQEYVHKSWKNEDKDLYGRFDFAYDGTGPAKLLEYNADTPTTLFEAASFQWRWMDDQRGKLLEPTADQFNYIFEAMSQRMKRVFNPSYPVYFTSDQGSDNAEDYGTVEMMGFAAREADFDPKYIRLEDIKLAGYDEDLNTNVFVDQDGNHIKQLFKLHPWEYIFADDICQNLPFTNWTIVEPPWKSLLSSKGILPLLWKQFKNHPNLLPAFFYDEEAGLPPSGNVLKPIFSREGQSIIVNTGKEFVKSEHHEFDNYPKILQKYHEIKKFDGFTPTIGVWMVGDESVGLSIREDTSIITQDSSVFKPHYIKD